MKALTDYINEITGQTVKLVPLGKAEEVRLPLYVTSSYEIQLGEIFGKRFAFIQPRPESEFTTGALMKQVRSISQQLNATGVLVANEMTTIRRRRLVNDRLNFIVPFKYLYLPDLMMDFREQADERTSLQPSSTLLPSAQFILFYHLLHRKEDRKVEGLPFKYMAELLGYTPMSITNAVQNLRLHGLCRVEGVKEKHIVFTGERPALWQNAFPFLASPVAKEIFVDQLPAGKIFYASGERALSAYSDLNNAGSPTFAIGKQLYTSFERTGLLKNANIYEGTYTLEIWKYDPEVLAFGLRDTAVVDPLSLYLNTRNTKDERVEMALDQIINQFIW